MLDKQHVAVMLASVAWLAGGQTYGAGTESLGAPMVLAQAADVRQEDRRDDGRREVGAQVSLTLPRSADGTVDTGALLDTLRASLAAGAREIQIRDASLTQQEARDLFLAPAPEQNLLRQIASAFPAGTGEFQVRFRNTVDARVQRQPDGSLRLRVEDIDLSALSTTQRADLAQQLSQQTGFDRVRLQGVDADGNRVRVEFRADKGLVQNVAQGSGNVARPASDNGQRQDDNAQRREDRQADRREERPADGQAERAGRGNSGRSDRPETQRAERAEFARIERVEIQRPERVEFQRPERAEIQRPERPERSGGGGGRH